VSGQDCKGKFQKYCVTDGGKCKTEKTCGKLDGDYYQFQYSCLPDGFKKSSSNKCVCKIKPPTAPPGTPPAPPGERFCAQLPYQACIDNAGQCDSRYGTACGNLQYTFCRGLRVCNTSDRCAQEPESGLNYLFLESCIPSGWISLPLNICKCSSTTTNKCPQCPPGYSCDPDGPFIPSNCVEITQVPILPPEAPTPPSDFFER